MGCCISHPADNDSPYPPVSSPNQAPDSSSRNITSTSPPTSAPITPRGSHSHHAQSQSQPTLSSGTRPNVPLKPIDPTYRSKLPATLSSLTVGSGSHRLHVSPLSDSVHSQWTRKRLEKERNDWWDTRTTGSAEIWSALRLMVESLQMGEVEEAQALLDATECTCPNGCLWRGVFDGRGEWYRVPEWVVIEPEGLLGEDEEMEADLGETANDGEVGLESEILGEPVKVRCRLSTNARDYNIGIRKGEKVAGLVHKLKSKAGINPFASVRIVYGGRIYDESQPLDSHPYWNYESKHTLIAMIFE